MGTLAAATGAASPTGGSSLAASAQSGALAFDDGPIHVPRGGVAEIPVSFAHSGNATLAVSAGSGNYSATLAVRDGDGDGTATVRLNTFDGTYRAADGDNVTVRSASSDAGPLAVGKYEVLACAADRSTCDAGTVAAKTLVTVGERSTDGLRIWVAPESASLSNLSEIEVARSSGNLTRSDVVARNDTLVLELRASGLEGAVAAQDGSNVTERFSAFLGRENVSLAVYDVPGPSQERASLDLTDPNAVTFVSDSKNHSYYVVADLRNASVTDGHGGDPANNEGLRNEHRANFTLAADSALTADGRESATAEFSIKHAEAEVDTPAGTDSVYLAPGPNQTIFGVTTLAPGSRVTVEVRRDDGEFSRTETVQVRNRSDGPGGAFAATVNLSGVREGTDLDAVVRSADGSRLTEPYVNGEVVARTADLNLSRRGVTDDGVRVARARLSHGGYVAVHRGSADGEVLGRSAYVAPGEEFDRFVEFDAALDGNATLVAVPHHAGSGDSLGEPYTENGTVVSDSVEYGTERTTDSTTETTVSVTTDTIRTSDPVSTSTTVTDPTKEPPERPPSVPVPGFGVAAAVVALLGAILLARRRNGEQ